MEELYFQLKHPMFYNINQEYNNVELLEKHAKKIFYFAESTIKIWNEHYNTDYRISLDKRESDETGIVYWLIVGLNGEHLPMALYSIMQTLSALMNEEGIFDMKNIALCYDAFASDIHLRITRNVDGTVPEWYTGDTNNSNNDYNSETDYVIGKQKHTYEYPIVPGASLHMTIDHYVSYKTN